MVGDGVQADECLRAVMDPKGLILNVNQVIRPVTF